MIASILYGATILGFFAYLLITLGYEEVTVPEIAALGIFILVFGVELLHHLHERTKMVKTTGVIIFNTIMTILFAIAVFFFINPLLADIVLKLLITLLGAGLYFVAIYPEKPF